VRIAARYTSTSFALARALKSTAARRWPPSKIGCASAAAIESTRWKSCRAASSVLTSRTPLNRSG